MKRIILSTALILVLSAILSFMPGVTFAQTRAEGLRLGIAGDIGVPVTNHTADLVLGPSLRLQWDFPRRTSLTLTGAYEAFLNKAQQRDGVNYISNQIPVKLGAKFFFGNSYTYYIQPEAGASFSDTKNYGTAFVYAGGLGYAAKRGLDLQLRYEGYDFGNSNKMSSKDNIGMVALRIAYGLPLKQR